MRDKADQEARRARAGPKEGSAWEKGGDRNQTSTASSSSPECWDPVWPGQEERQRAPRGHVCPGWLWRSSLETTSPTGSSSQKGLRSLLLGHRCPTGCPLLCVWRGACSQAGAGPWDCVLPWTGQRGRRCNGQRHAQEPPKLTVPQFPHL